MSTQNLITVAFTDPQLTAMDDAIADVETQFAPLIALTPEQKRSMKKMGEKSEAFCRQALHMAEQNPHIIPANVPLADAIGDLKALDQLRPRLMRILRLAQRAADRDGARQRRDDGGAEGLRAVEAHRSLRRPRECPSRARRPLHEDRSKAGGARRITPAVRGTRKKPQRCGFFLGRSPDSRHRRAPAGAPITRIA